MTNFPTTLSQTSLNDYIECPRRFELRYIQRVPWTAPLAEPLAEYERRTAQGAAFHRLVHQALLGIPAERLTPLAHAQGIGAWWENFLQAGLHRLGGQRFPERTLSALLNADVRLVARYDLVIAADQVIIIEWKTGHRQPPRQQLEARLQTVVYRYVMARAGGALTNSPQTEIAPERINMVYWYAQHPDAPEHFAYDATQFAADHAYLTELLTEMRTRTTFDLTADKTRCRFCAYRALCRRGTKAGSVEEWDEDDVNVFDTDVDF